MDRTRTRTALWTLLALAGCSTSSGVPTDAGPASDVWVQDAPPISPDSGLADSGPFIDGGPDTFDSGTMAEPPPGPPIIACGEPRRLPPRIEVSSAGVCPTISEGSLVAVESTGGGMRIRLVHGGDLDAEPCTVHVEGLGPEVVDAVSSFVGTTYGALLDDDAVWIVDGEDFWGCAAGMDSATGYGLIFASASSANEDRAAFGFEVDISEQTCVGRDEGCELYAAGVRARMLERDCTVRPLGSFVAGDTTEWTSGGERFGLTVNRDLTSRFCPSIDVEGSFVEDIHSRWVAWREPS